MHLLHQKNINNCPLELKRAGLLIPSQTTIKISMCSMGPISNKRYILSLEKVRRKTASFVKHDYSKYNSVTRMIHELVWKTWKIEEKI